MYPLWPAHGIGRLANLLILIRFYSILSNNSKVRIRPSLIVVVVVLSVVLVEVAAIAILEVGSVAIVH